MKKLLFLLPLSLTLSLAQAQDAKGLVGKKWVTESHEVQGQRFSTNTPDGDGTVFNEDGTYTSVDNGIRSSGTWRLDPETGKLKFKNDKEETALNVEVVLLTDEEFILRMRSKGREMDVVMKAKALDE
jgi:hypothetical protein